MSDRQHRYTNKVIVITGASSGFGKGCAMKFAGEGASVVLAARREHLLDDLARHCENAGSRALAVPTDVAQENDVRQLAEAAVLRFKRIDVWINNAGSGAVGIFEEIPLADHLRVIETDLIGTLYGSYFAMQQFWRQGAGILINVASVIGKVPAPYFSSYAAAKHGVVGLSASLRHELQQAKVENIRVCTVMPSTFDTPFFEHAGQYTGRQATPIPPTEDPRKVVDAIADLVLHPKDEVSVGAMAKVSTITPDISGSDRVDDG
jgi:short-subunit dehydrogenase